ncbi:PAS domain S-box protein [Aggregicoccus sp. 17bor-14]|uniref:PAS domain-containing sensor histidine kinase n=1 Tax=Myxococcaceae TaxID=31 RepID=UPI00129C59E6|nr:MULTISPECIES: ATP-binding protein [Myxococcaceae]MBF5043445.1 PAS domain-containing protein [Simulacricoccus sp. 17bor-14]MRI89203.1 PAS domain S-box protein [Aggregicoccus sp. 17bor-14]
MPAVVVPPFQEIVAALRAPLVTLDRAGRILHLNPAAERLLGWPLSEAVGQPFARLMPAPPGGDGAKEGPDAVSRAWLQRELAQFEAGERRPTRLTLLRRNGVHLDAFASVSPGGSGEGEGFTVVTLRQLPERLDFDSGGAGADAGAGGEGDGGSCAAVEQRLSASGGGVDPLYRLVFDNAPLGLFHFDAAGVMTACNDPMVRILGSSRRQLIGLNLLTLRDERVVACVRHTLAGERSFYEGDYASTTAPKVTPVRAKFSPCHGPDGRVTGGVALVEDVSLQRRVEFERSTTLAQLDTLYRTAPIGLAFLDASLRFVRVNDVMAGMTRRSVEEHTGRTLQEVVGRRAASVGEPLVRHVLETGEPVVRYHVDSVSLGVPGPRLDWEGSFYRVETADGHVLGVGAVAEDVTERKRVEDELSRLYTEAKKAIQVRDDFLSIASHELKTPLTPLALRLAALERKLEQGEHIDPSLLRRSRRQLVRMTSLINDLLDASRIEAGRLALHPKPTQLDALVAHAVAALSQESARGRIVTECAEGLMVRGDPDRLEQVVVNLLENALKYSPSGSRVHVGLMARGDLALLSVRDEGIGIPQDDQEHLFDRYFRARNVSTHSYGGLGLGLYISRDIVERHGGRIWVESEAGKGATFYVALPLMHAAPLHTPLESGGASMH